MGQKVNPIGFRLGVNKTWQSRWYAEKSYANFLHEDLKIKKFIKKAFHHAGISRIEVERAAEKTTINVHTARPGILIGRRGAEVDQLKKKLQKLTEHDVHVNIFEVRKAEVDAGGEIVPRDRVQGRVQHLLPQKPEVQLAERRPETTVFD